GRCHTWCGSAPAMRRCTAWVTRPLGSLPSPARRPWLPERRCKTEAGQASFASIPPSFDGVLGRPKPVGSRDLSCPCPEPQDRAAGGKSDLVDRLSNEAPKTTLKGEDDRPGHDHWFHPKDARGGRS